MEKCWKNVLGVFSLGCPYRSNGTKTWLTPALALGFVAKLASNIKRIKVNVRGLVNFYSQVSCSFHLLKFGRRPVGFVLFLFPNFSIYFF